MGFLFAFSLGVFSVAWWQELPDQLLYLLALTAFSLISGCLLKFWSSMRWARPVMLIICYLWGSGWGLIAAYQTLGHLLPDSLDRRDLLVQGTIVGLVDSDKQRSRFHFRVDGAHTEKEADTKVNLQMLQLSSYDQKGVNQRLVPGDHWQFKVRLRRPRGFLNPGTFDYERWLIQGGVSATGYILPTELNAQINQPKHSYWCRFRDRVSRWRNEIALAIEEAELTNHGKAVLAALTIGDKRRITSLWNSLARLGIVHLMIVSGLHVGLVAGFGFMLGTFVAALLTAGSRLFSAVIQLSPGTKWLPPMAGFIAAASYSLLAGFSLPAQRALIAVSVVMLARLCLRRIRPMACIVWALFLIALSQPLAVLSSGFWLSFIAVIILVSWFYPWQSARVRFGFKPLISAQLALTAGLLVPSLVLVGIASWLGPLVNLLAVPWVSLITVPLALLGCLGLLFSFQSAEMIWQLADYSITGLWYLLDLIPEHFGIITTPVPLTPLLVSCALVAVISWLLPRGLGVRLMGSLPLIAYMSAPADSYALRLTVLDVGQGLAVVLEAPDQVLVYDAGPAYGSRFNAGAGVIAPYLRSRGHTQIDQLVVSHEDMDHAGGLPGLMDAMPAGELILGPGLGEILIADTYLPTDSRVCEAGQTWSWPLGDSNGASQDVYFEMLAPDSYSSLTEQPEGNNYSCVLLIRWRDQLILLPGDIERDIEAGLLADQLLPEVDILLAPHHGSKTSSTAAFVAALSPRHVVFSAGYRHQFGHPHRDVSGRYHSVGSRLWNTAEQGGLSFIWSESGSLSVAGARVQGRRFWWRAQSVDPRGFMLEFDPDTEH